MALRLAGDSPTSRTWPRAAAWVRDHGGVERPVCSPTSGWPWWAAGTGTKLPAVPPELVFLPPDWPLSIWSFACWARQTIVALSVIMAHRPLATPPLRGRRAPIGQRTRAGAGSGPARLSSRRPRQGPTPLRGGGRASRGRSGSSEARLCGRRSAGWSPARKPTAAGAGSSRPWSTRPSPSSCRVTRSTTLWWPPLSPAWSAFTLDDERGRRIEACQSPVWDTALAAIALADAGTAPDDPSIKAARRLAAEKEVTVVGDWAVRRPDLPPGGWSFEFAERPLPRHRRHRRGGLGSSPRRRPAPKATAHATGRSTGWSGCSRATAVGVPSTPTTTSTLPNAAALLRLRRRHRPADGRRHGARRRDARLRASAPANAGLAGGSEEGRRMAVCPPGTRRFVLGPLGRQLRLRDGGRAAGADRRRRPRQGPDGGRRRPLARGAPEP